MVTANQVGPVAQLREHMEQPMKAGDFYASYAALITVDAECVPVSRMVTQVEQWISSLSDRLHDRRLYRWDDEVWQMETLVP